MASHEPSRGAAGPDPTARVLLLLAVVLGAVRFLRLGEWSLWIDEALTLADYHHGLDDGQIRNPLGYLVVGWVSSLFPGPPDERALRFAPAVCGWLSIPLAAWALRPLAGARVAAAAALLLAVSSWHVFWSQNARFYTMAQLVGLAGGGVYVRALLSGSVVRAVLGLGVVGLSAFFHPSGGLLVPSLVGAPWLLRGLGVPLPQASRRPALAGLLLSVLGVLVFHRWAFAVWNRYWWNKPIGDPAHFVLTTGFYVTPLIGVGALLGTALSLRRRDPLALLCVAVCVIMLGAGLLASSRVTVSAQYVFVLLPWVVWIACVPLASTSSARPSFHAAGYFLLLFLPTLTDTALYFDIRHGDRPMWREAYAYVWNERGPDDLVFGLAAPVGEYYASPGSTYLRHPEEVAWVEKWRVAAKLPQQWARQRRRTWFVLREAWIDGFFEEDREPFRRMLREECRLAKQFPLWVQGRDLSVTVYVRD